VKEEVPAVPRKTSTMLAPPGEEEEGDRDEIDSHRNLSPPSWISKPKSAVFAR